MDKKKQLIFNPTKPIMNSALKSMKTSKNEDTKSITNSICHIINNSDMIGC